MLISMGKCAKSWITFHNSHFSQQIYDYLGARLRGCLVKGFGLDTIVDID
jgi:hypothetical protein